MSYRHSRLGSRGQTLAEVAIALPMLIVLVVGMLQVGWVLYQGHVVRKVAREGANLISRQVTFADTGTVIRGSSVYPGGAFDANATMILSVIRPGAGSNAGFNVITQRLTIGSLGGASVVGSPGAGSYSGSPNYTALNPDTDTGIRAVNPLPNGLTLSAGQAVYVSELYTRRSDMDSLTHWGVAFPATLYASAFF